MHAVSRSQACDMVYTFRHVAGICWPECAPELMDVLRP